MIDIIFNAGEHAERFAEIITTLGITTYAGTDGTNVKFRIPVGDGFHPEEFREALETLYAANFPKEA